MTDGGNGKTQAPLYTDALGPRRSLTFLDVLLACAVTSAIVLISVIALGVVVANGGRFADMPASLAAVALLTIEPVAIFAGVYFILILRRRFDWADLGLRPMTRSWAAPAVLAALGCLIFSGAVSQVFERFYNTPMLDEYVSLLAPEGTTWQQEVALIVLIGGLVPLAEELLFRGVLYAWLRQRWGVAVSAVVSAGLFALAHGSLRMGLQIFVTGVVLAVLYERSRSILASTLAHMTVNTISMVIIFSYAAHGGAV
jgi:membrane protease YdiL (CAAX protease family)